jgi:hypothetical protein
LALIHICNHDDRDEKCREKNESPSTLRLFSLLSANLKISQQAISLLRHLNNPPSPPIHRQQDILTLFALARYIIAFKTLRKNGILKRNSH